MPMIFTAVAPGFAASAQVLAAGCRAIPPSSPSMTAMSVPTFPGSPGSPGSHWGSRTGELLSPPNWLKPKLPSGASVRGRGDDPPAVAEVGGSSSAIRAVPSSAQCPAVSTTGSPAALNAPNPVEQMVRRSTAKPSPPKTSASVVTGDPCSSSTLAYRPTKSAGEVFPGAVDAGSGAGVACWSGAWVKPASAVFVPPVRIMKFSPA